MKENTLIETKTNIETLRAKLRLHFMLDQPHTEANLSELIHLVDLIEKEQNNAKFVSTFTKEEFDQVASNPRNYDDNNDMFY